MGSGVSHLVGCFMRPRDGCSDGGGGLEFSEPLDEGLGHSFCYVRPPPLGSPPLVTPDKSEEFTMAVGSDDAYVDAVDLTSLSKDERMNYLGDKGRFSLVDRPRLSGPGDKAKIASETSFKAISGASVSANTATLRSIISCEQFNSFSNVLYERAAAFESTSSFSAIPLQPVPRGFSGPLSGPLDRGDRGFMSGPLERERGFMSGPLERGFMSGPLERVCISGPLDATADRTHFSAPLNTSYHYSGYFRKRKKSLVHFIKIISRPMKKAFIKTASSLARTHRSIVSPVKTDASNRDRNNEMREGDKDKRGAASRQGIVDHFDPSVDFSSSELDLRDTDNLQWAQGKAGEDRVHVVLSEEHGWLFVGIYDGFNGPDAPDFLMSNLYPAVFQELHGLLWDRKRDGLGVPTVGAEEIGEAVQWDPVSDRQGDSGLRARDERLNCRREMVHRDMLLKKGGGRCISADRSRRESGRGQFGSVEKSSVEMESNGADGDIPKLSLVDSIAVESGMRVCGTKEEIQWVSCEGCSEPCALQVLNEKSLCLVGGGVYRDTGREEVGAGLQVEGVHAQDTVSARQAGKGWVDGNIDEIVNQGPSDRPQSNDSNLDKKSTTGIKLCRGHDRQEQQLSKYFQWRYGWDQDDSVGVVRKVKDPEVIQEPGLTCESRVDHSSVLRALARALQTTENAYLDMADKVLYENPELALMGSCVLVMLMKDEDMYILNVGDSRAIIAQHPTPEPLSTVLGKGTRNGPHGNDCGARDSLLRLELGRIIEETPMELEALEAACENGSVDCPPVSGPSLLGAFQLTTDHSTNIKEEVVRLRAEHPDDDTIENDRVKGKLKVTRAFGAGFLKQPKWNDALLEMFQINFIGTAPYITCSPALYHHRLGPQDHFLVLSSDGLYQYFSNEEVVTHVEWFMMRFPDGDPAQHLIEELLFRAAKKAGMDFHELLDIPQGDRRKYHDDVSVMVISLEGRIWRSSG